MSYAIFQAVVVTLVIGWSLWFSVRRFLPRVYRGAVARVAAALETSSQPAMRALGAKLMPHQVASGGGCDSGGGCSSCGTCAPNAAPPSDVHPLVFRPRAKS